MSKRFTFLGWLILFIPSTISLVFHGYLGHFNRLLADDFCSAYIAHRLGFFRSIWFWYLNWSGGYSQSIADFFLEVIGRKGMPYIVPVFLIIWYVVTILAILALLPADLDNWVKIWISTGMSALVLFAIYLLSPSIPQALYWWGSMRKYGISLLISTLYILIFWLFTQKAQGNWVRWVGYIVSFFVIFLNSGFSETFTPVQIVFFAMAIGFGLWIKYLKWQSPAFYFLTGGFAGAVLGLIIMMIAPGNSLRQSYFATSPGFLDVLKISVSAYTAFLVWLFSAPERVLGLLAVIFAGVWTGIQLNIKVKVSLWAAVVIVMLGFVFVFGCFPPAAYALSDAPPDRSLVVAVYFLVLSLIFGGVVIGVWLSQRMNRALAAKPVVIIILIVCVLFPAWSNVQQLYTSRQAYITYAQQWDAMDAQILAAKNQGQSEVHIPAKQNWAGVHEPNDNPKFYVTMCISKYYDIQVFAPRFVEP